MTDTVEFYREDSYYPFASVDSSFAPNEGDLISIIGETWEVIGRSFSVDNANDPRCKAMRCNVIVRAAVQPTDGASVEGEK